MPSIQETQKMGTKSPGIEVGWWTVWSLNWGPHKSIRCFLPDASSLQHQGTQSCQAIRWWTGPMLSKGLDCYLLYNMNERTLVWENSHFRNCYSRPLTAHDNRNSATHNVSMAQWCTWEKTGNSETSLVYIKSSRPARHTQLRPFLKTQTHPAATVELIC